MTATNFLPCLNFTLAEEGGFASNPADNGGPTNMGITQATLAASRGHSVTAADVQALTHAEAEQIYLDDYWHPVDGDAMPAGLDLMMFDFGVNVGPGTSAKRLQALLKCRIDGIIGPVTLGAVAAHDIRWLITTLGYSQQAYYNQIGGPFLPGWLARTQRRTAEALKMASC